MHDPHPPQLRIEHIELGGGVQVNPEIRRGMLFPSVTPVQLSNTFPVYDHLLALCILHDEIRLASTIEPFVIHREFRAVGAESHVEELLVDGLRLEELRGVWGPVVGKKFASQIGNS